MGYIPLHQNTIFYIVFLFILNYIDHFTYKVLISRETSIVLEVRDNSTKTHTDTTNNCFILKCI